VGIGTSSPARKLDVAGGVNSTGLNVTGVGGFFNAANKFGVDNNAGATRMYSSGPDASTRGSYDFRATDSVGTLDTSRMVIDSSGRVGIGTSSPLANCVISDGANGVEIAPGVSSSTVCQITSYNRSSNAYSNFNFDAASTRFSISGAERLRIDSSGRLLVGTSSASGGYLNNNSLVHVQAEGPSAGITIHRPTTFSALAGPYLLFSRSRGTPAVIVNSGDNLGSIEWGGADGTDVESVAAAIRAEVDGTPGANDMPGRLVFSTTADGASSPTERLRIDSNGLVTAGSEGINGFQALLLNSGEIDTSGGLFTLRTVSNNTGGYYQAFRNANNNIIGTISQNGIISVAYNTSSDYRLKENVVPLTGAIDRLNDLQVHRFNFIADPDYTVDGFIAHEAADVVPECVTGEKDAIDDDGNPIYQGIDQSKLVPLLTAALQEAIARIETLEAAVAALQSA